MKTRGVPEIQITNFRGCNDLIEEVSLPPDFVPWSHGGYYNERAQLERVRGKLAATSTTSSGLILSLHQLQFPSQNVLVVQASSTMTAYQALEALRSDPTAFHPLNPFVL